MSARKVKEQPAQYKAEPKATLLQDAEVDTLVQEADELVRILATIINKSKRTL